jgi:phosphoglucosamine mutase
MDDAIGRYIVFLKNTFPNELTLEGLRIVLDCANGAGYKVGPAVLEELGAKVLPIGVNPNGENINLNCGSLHTKAMQEKVRQEKADLGIALDGDADRVILCDEKGEIVDGDQILFALGLDLYARGQLKSNTLVATVMSNMGMEVALRDKGISLVRTAVGDRYVVDEMRKNNFNFGGEQSGHLVFLDHNTTGDGMISALQVLAYLQREKKTLGSMTRGFDVYPQCQINIPVREKPPLSENKNIQGIKTKVESTLKDQGRVLVRYSGTELLARVMVEGKQEKKVESLANEIAQVIRAEIGH